MSIIHSSQNCYEGQAKRMTGNDKARVGDKAESKATPCTPSAYGGDRTPENKNPLESEESIRPGPKEKYGEELFERVLQRVAEGEPVTSSVRAEGMGVSRFYERVDESPEWKAALKKARQVKVVATLEDKVLHQIFEGEAKMVYWKGYPVGEERVVSDGLLMFLLKTLAPEKYGNTRASAKRQAKLDGAEARFARTLVKVQEGLDLQRQKYSEILTRAGLPVPGRRKAESKAPLCYYKNKYRYYSMLYDSHVRRYATFYANACLRFEIWLKSGMEFEIVKHFDSRNSLRECFDLSSSDSILGAMNPESGKCMLCDGLIEHERNTCVPCWRWSIQVSLQLLTIVLALILFYLGIYDRDRKIREAAAREALSYDRVTTHALVTEFQLNLQAIKVNAIALENDINLLTSNKYIVCSLLSMRTGQWNMIRSRIPTPILKRSIIWNKLVYISILEEQLNDALQTRELFQCIGNPAGYAGHLQVKDGYVIREGNTLSNHTVEVISMLSSPEITKELQLAGSKSTAIAP